MAHAESCSCALCTNVRAGAVAITPANRESLACERKTWVSTTGVSAMRASKHFTGIGHNPQYFATEIARIAGAVEALAIGETA